MTDTVTALPAEPGLGSDSMAMLEAVHRFADEVMRPAGATARPARRSGAT